MKQWELPNNSKVLLPDGTTAIFLKMDEAYAKWDDGSGEMKTGNFEELEQIEQGVYRVVSMSSEGNL